ncbi:MAG: hypothetical protein Q7R31_00720 [Candidatus Levybacteria bacterium]|nr:hypothetical protein [Candidatus Levybacteria bacterium]
MINDINLLVGKDANYLRQKKLLSLVRLMAFASLGIVALLSVIAFFLNSQFSPTEVKKEEDVILQNLSTLSKKQAKLFIINNRIQNITTILNSRVDYYKILNFIIGKIPAEVSIDRIEVDKKKISLTISSNSLIPINTLINNFVDMVRKKETITSLTLNSLTLSVKTSKYSISLDASL